MNAEIKMKEEPTCATAKRLIGNNLSAKFMAIQVHNRKYLIKIKFYFAI